MAKRFSLSVDVVMNKYIEVEAENKADAFEKLEAAFARNPYDFTSDFSCYVGHEIISVEPED